jgi:hypothetical protein
MATHVTPYGVYNGTMTASDYATTTFDLAFNKPMLYEAIVKQHSTQYRDTIGLDFRKMGLEKPMSSNYGTMFLEGWTHENFVVAAGGVGASSAGGTQVIPIDSTSMNSGRTYVKEGHVIVYPSATNEQGTIESIDLAVPAITVRAGENVILPLLAGAETISIVSSNWGQGTTQPQPSKKEYEQIHFYPQILKDEIGIDGSQLTNDAVVLTSEYNTPYKFFNVALIDMDHRMDRQEEGAYLTGTGLLTTPTADTAIINSDSSATIRETKGIITWGKERGENAEVETTTIDTTDLRAIRTYFQSEGDMSTNIFGWAGQTFGEALSDELWTDVQTSGADPITTAMTMIMGDNRIDEAEAKARAVTINYRQWNDFSGSFVIKNIPAFSDPKGLGATGYTYKKKSLWFPSCNIKDGQSNKTYPNVMTRYKAKDGYSRRRELVEMVGATNGMHNTQMDYNLAGHKSEVAMQVMNPTLIYMTYDED